MRKCDLGGAFLDIPNEEKNIGVPYQVREIYLIFFRRV